MATSDDELRIIDETIAELSASIPSELHDDTNDVLRRSRHLRDLLFTSTLGVLRGRVAEFEECQRRLLSVYTRLKGISSFRNNHAVMAECLLLECAMLCGRVVTAKERGEVLACGLAMRAMLREVNGHLNNIPGSRLSDGLHVLWIKFFRFICRVPPAPVDVRQRESLREESRKLQQRFSEMSTIRLAEVDPASRPFHLRSRCYEPSGLGKLQSPLERIFQDPLQRIMDAYSPSLFDKEWWEQPDSVSPAVALTHRTDTTP